LKILFLQEYVREAHMKKDGDGTFKNIFFQTKGGQILKKLIEDGLGLKRNEYYIDYAYSLVPKVIARDKYNRATKYKPPSQKEANEEYQYLFDRILREKPDIIVPTGNIGCKALIGQSAISQLRGVPEKVTVKTKNEQDGPVDEMKLVDLQKRMEMYEEEREAFLNAYGDRMEGSRSLEKEYNQIMNKIENLHNEINVINGSGSSSHECWVLPMYSMEYMLVNPSVQNLIEADFVTLKKFVDSGESAFEASPVEYEFVDKIERVREIFTKEVTEAPIVSWDLETNTLRPELPGAKPLVISICVKEGEGFTIPLEHKEFQWLPGHLAEIYKYIEKFVGDPKIIKVGHNLQYDIRFLRLVRNINKFANNRDTKVMYYLLVNQAVESSLKLSDLSYELTDMGGYDKALDEYKKKYIQDYVAKEKTRIEKLKADYKIQVAEEKELAKLEGRKPRKIEKPQFPKAEPPRNEIDGGDFNYEWIPLREMLHPYASGDVDACLRIHNKLDAIGSKPENAKLRKLYTEHYTDLTVTLATVEANGVMMDVAYNESLIEAYTAEEDRLLQEMRKIPEVQRLEAEHRELYQRGVEEMAIPKAQRNEEVAKLRDKYKKKLVFNPNSSDDKKKVLFEYTGNTLPYNKEFIVDSAFEDGIPEDEIEWYHYKADTKGALPYVVKNYPESKELASLLLTHSLVKTRKQNFTYKLLGMVDHTNRIHGGFNSTGTETTRLSSSNPNLQQLPRKTGDVNRFDYRYPIKRMFVTSFEGGALLQLDYSSLESRILGLAAMDEEMTQAFLDGKDLHKETATIVYGVPIEEVTDDMRSMAKSVTFGIAYGETPFSFAPKHGMTVDEAEVVFDKYFKNKPRVKAFIDATHEQVKRDGYVECLHGFRRNLRDVYSQDSSKRNGALRQSVNTKIQGSGAFLTNCSVIYINKFIENNNFRSKVILTVHDSIVLDCPPEEVHIMARAARHIMENLPIEWLTIDWKGEKLRYPVKADVEIGVTYNDMVDYDMEEINSFSTIKNYCKYHLDLKRVKNYKESKVIDEDKYEELKKAIEGSKEVYQTAS
jgi:DNA polymerase I-like protein with 3'-5' exonuclease and polymerase domains/uracil-DNA glycosylase